MEFKYVPTTCPFCGTGCSINLVVVDGKVAGSAPFQRSPVCEGKTCQKGHFAHEFVNSAERLTTPLIKKNGELAEASWDEAYALIAEKLRGYSGGDIAVVASSNATNEDVYVLNKFASEVLKTENVTSTAAIGVPAMAGSIEEIGDADCVVAIGNVFESHPIVSRRIGIAQRKGAKVIAIDAIATPTSKMADIFVQNAPGADIATIAALEAALGGGGDGAVGDAAAAIKAAGKVAVVYGLGRSAADAATAQAATNLAVAAGAKGAFVLASQSNSVGTVAMGAKAPFGEVINSGAKAFVIMGEDVGPVEAEFVLVSDIFLSDTARGADIVLPAAAYAEKEGTAINTERRIQLVRKAQDAPGEAKAEWQIFAGLAAKMGSDFGYDSAAAVFGAITEKVPEFSGLTFEALETDGFQYEGRVAAAAPVEAPAAVATSDNYPFALITGASVWHSCGAAGTMTARCPSLVHEVPSTWVTINKADASALGLKAGEVAKVTSESGSIEAPVKISADVNEGICFIPTFSLDGTCACALTCSDKACAVKIEKKEA